MRRSTSFLAAALGLSLLGAAPIDAPPTAPPKPSVEPARLLRTLAHDPAGYNPERVQIATDLLLGDFLFHAPSTLGPRAQALGISCNSCHTNGAGNRAFVIPGEKPTHPGLVDVSTDFFRKESDDHRDNPIDIPSLRGVRYTAPFGHDGRTASLYDFAQSVVVNEFAGAPLNWIELASLVIYMRDFDFLPNANLDAQSRLTPRTSAAARRGELAFKKPREGFDGRSCASCHVPSSFFRDGQVHRIPVATQAAPGGFEDAFETPTLLGLGETAPYFHDGRFATLAEVVAFFDTTFGLKLAPAERADLVAYLDAVGSADAPEDARPLAQKLDATWVYLELLGGSVVKDDRRVWASVVALCTEALDGAPRRPAYDDRRLRLRDRLAALGSRAKSGANLEPLRAEPRALHTDLLRYGADLQGAIAAEH